MTVTIALLRVFVGSFLVGLAVGVALGVAVRLVRNILNASD